MGSLFLNLEGFPPDGMTNPEAFKKFVREHQRPSFLEYSEYEGVTVKEIKRALAVEKGVLGDARRDAVSWGRDTRT